ncbi:cytochrome C peroxidase [Mucilaginibacter mali]|uniref:Cytochrome C peroxidase n=1 Tax=Mucilaginibacter mali TaxID=2740462 RepID=A0A7D4Q1N5_9SPHI|nr:cytochrome c peroxidase [Mucilaginibacter mali]QKJ30606.1 cytochrome C peroxidase [Mucilaginibacter mali]
MPVIVTGILVILLLLPSLALPLKAPSCTEQVIGDVKIKCGVFAQSCGQVQLEIGRLKQDDAGSIKNARFALLACRRDYKAIAWFLEYYFKTSAAGFNAPPKFDAEEPEDDYREPVGMQVMEALLFDKNVVARKEKLQQLADLLVNAAHNLPGLFINFHTSDAQLLRSLQVTLVRIMTLDITGYDAPLFKSGIAEAGDAMVALQNALAPYLRQQPSARVSSLLADGISYLKAHTDFNSFNRMRFLTVYAMPLQEELNRYIVQAKLDVKSTGIFNAQAKNIFSRDALNSRVFLDFPEKNRQLIALGRRLFFDKRLSGPATRSCATCHQPERYFTDGLPQSKTISRHGHVLRNAPTLLYAGFQYSQFWDARAKSMVEQVQEVLHNKQEMAGNDSIIISRLLRDKSYAALFKSAFPMPVYQRATMYGIAEGLTAYVLSLSPRNSAFDRYMAGDRAALTNSEINGFNLFMGKGQCGSCHFAPLFNGLVPPFYETSEMEIIGVPQTDSRKNALADTDEGAYRQMPVNYMKGAFKTPTVRNIAKTGPYMHSGAFHNLNTVMDFYNAGGGNGWGLNNGDQTLASDSLKLTKREIKAIVAFMNILTDKLVRKKGLDPKLY